jgi:dTDP-4-dehydrorhamnose reductase
MTDFAITGCHGQLGRALVLQARARGLAVSAHDVDTLDIRSEAAVEAWITAERPSVVMNCAAYTAVDAAEHDEAAAHAVNATAVGILAKASAAVDARLVHVSTDYVFDGSAAEPYRESDPTCPTSAYGRSKLAGEREAARCDRHLIVRTAWLYGIGGRNFVEAIRRQILSGRERLRVVADQRGCPTFCDDLAGSILDLVDADAQGVVHAVNVGETTWHGFATAIVRGLGASTPVDPVGTEEFPTPARRPAYSVLATDRLHRLIGRRLPPWEDALNRYLERT